MADVDVQGFVPVTDEHADIPDVLPPEAPDANGHVELDAAAADEGPGEDEMPDDAAMDGHAVEDTVQAVPAKAAAPKPERLYFVRLPKPDLGDEDIAIEKIKAEFNSLKEGCDLLLATLKVERVKQDEAKRDFEAADMVFQESRAAQDKWREQLEPLRNANKLVTEQRSQMEDNFRELSARTEAELDKMIEDVEYTISHETLNVHEERKLIAQLKKLEQSRPRVRSAEAAMVQLEQSKEHLDDFRLHKQELEKKLDMIRAEVNEAKEVKGARYAVLKAIRTRTNQLADELTAMRASKDAKWEELNKLRDARKAKLDQYYENRRFSQTVRTLLTGGPEGIAEAKNQCAELNDRLVATLLDDSEFRSDYFDQWDLQRKYSVTLAELTLETAPAKKAVSKATNNGTAASGKTRAQDIISALMAEADAELGRAPATSTSAATAKSLLPTTNGHAAPAPAEVPGNDFVAKAKPAPKPRAEKAKPAAPPPEVKDVYEEFVPPTRAPEAKKVSEEEQRRAVREEQRLKAQEAEERKKRREEAKAKKLTKAQELAKQKEEEEELKAELERERIQREAEEQRRREARRKEEAKRKAATSKTPVKNKHSPQTKELAAAKKPKAKLTPYARVKKFAVEHKLLVPLLSIAGIVVALAVVIFFMTQLGG